MHNYILIDSSNPPRVKRLMTDLTQRAGAPEEYTTVELPVPYGYWPNKPYPEAELVWLNGQVVWHDPRSLQEVKEAKRKEINEARLKANRTFFTFSGKQIACDELSRGDIDGVTSEVALTGALPVTFPNAWKAVDNTYISIPDVATWKLFVSAMVQQGTLNFMHSQALKAQLDAASTTEEAALIEWGDGP